MIPLANNNASHILGPRNPIDTKFHEEYDVGVTILLKIPEIWSHFPDDLDLKKKGINYGIFIQGFFHMNSTSDFKKLK